MRRSISLSVIAILLFLAAQSAWPQQSSQQGPPAKPPQAQDQPQQPISQQNPPKIVTRVGLVHLVAAVMDRHNHFITNLNQYDFKVLEDGQPQKITFFSREADLPLRIAVLLDTSNSIRERLHFEKDAAVDFLYNVIRRHKDEAFLMTFDNEPEIIADYTDDVGELSSVIQRQNAGGGTALNDAIYMASKKLMNAPAPEGPNSEVRRVLVLISDGDDNLSEHAASDAVQMADRAGVSIYTISTNNEWVTLDTAEPEKLHKSPGDHMLDELADETGGRAFFPYRVDDLAQSFLDIGSELRSQYLIGYAPPYKTADGRFHHVELRVDRKGLIVRSRKGYFATAPVTTPAQETSADSPQK